MKKKLMASAVLLALSAAAQASPAFVNGLALPGGMLDLSGGTTANTGRMGFFSDIYYDPNRNEWWALSDRGPGGGLLSYETRVQKFTLDVDQNTGAISNFKITQTLIFNNNGNALNGLAPNPSNTLGRSFDSEGVVINPRNGNLLVSDEYGPSLVEIDRNTGSVVKTYTTPANIVPRNTATGTPNYTSDTGNDAGKRTNRGFEGLAISPDGKFAFAMLQSAMLDEGAGNGTMVRIVKYDTTTGLAVGQYAYQLKRSGQGTGISSLVAINDHEFYVLERNNRGVGVGADFATADKEVYRINLNGATDVTNIDLDAPGAVYTKVTKSGQILDLDANTLLAMGNKSPEKWESLAIGPKLADGSYLLLAGTDNDYSVTQSGNGNQFDVYFRLTDSDPYASSIQCPLDSTTNCFYTTGGGAALLDNNYALLPGVLHAYKLAASELGDYVAPVSEPATYAMFLGGLGLLGFSRRRALNNSLGTH